MLCRKNGFHGMQMSLLAASIILLIMPSQFDSTFFIYEKNDDNNNNKMQALNSRECEKQQMRQVFSGHCQPLSMRNGRSNARSFVRRRQLCLIKRKSAPNAGCPACNVTSEIWRGISFRKQL